MTKKHSTKRSLIASFLTLCLCFTMLIGTTFAWFTDSVTSGGNVIKSGKLDIKAEYTLDGVKWADLDGANDLFQKGLWEPGHTELIALRITNVGSLSLKYTVNMKILNETVGKTENGSDIVLSEILKVSTLSMNEEEITDELSNAFDDENGVLYANTSSLKDASVLGADKALAPEDVHYVFVKVDMPSSVGNEANSDGVNVPEIDFGINVVATQHTYESDSFDDQYDSEAEIPILVNSFADMVNVCKTGGYMILGNDITYTAENTEMMIGGSIFLINGKNVTLDLNGHNITVEEDAKHIYGAIFFTGNPGGHINIVGDGEITVKNGLATIVWVLQTGTADIYDGTYTSNSVSNEAMIYSQGNGGVVNVYGGKYTYDLDRHLNGGFNVSDQAGNALRIIIHEGVLLSRPEYSQHLQGTTNGEQNRIQLAEGCSLEEVVIDGETWYQVVKE